MRGCSVFHRGHALFFVVGRPKNVLCSLGLKRNNYLFGGLRGVAINIAKYRSLFTAGQLAGHDPYAWMMYILHQLPVTPDEEYVNLLPQNVAAETLAPYGPVALARTTA